jgi:hypothetical protein
MRSRPLRSLIRFKKCQYTRKSPITPAIVYALNKNEFYDNFSINVAAIRFFVCLMVLNATFINISVISWRSVLLVEETGEPGENHRPVASH